jgi:hypothetical protein
MKFLTNKDISLTIEDDKLLQIINDKEYLKDQAERRALTTVKEYLSQRYDTSFELRAYVDITGSTSGTSGLISDERFLIDSVDGGDVFVNGTSGILADDRNFSLVTITLDIWKYEIFQRVSPRAISQIVMDRYDLGIQKLKDANRGKLQMELKEKYETGSQNNRPFRWGKSDESGRWSY